MVLDVLDNWDFMHAWFLNLLKLLNFSFYILVTYLGQRKVVFYLFLVVQMNLQKNGYGIGISVSIITQDGYENEERYLILVALG